MSKCFHCIILCLLSITASSCVSTDTASMNHQEPENDLFLMSVEAQRAYRESRWIDSVRLYQTLVERLPSDAYAWFYLANTYAQQGAFQPAIHAYEQSLRHDTEQPKAWFNLSRVYLLNAQLAMRQSMSLMAVTDPARDAIVKNLKTLEDLIHARKQP